MFDRPESRLLRACAKFSARAGSAPRPELHLCCRRHPPRRARSPGCVERASKRRPPRNRERSSRPSSPGVLSVARRADCCGPGGGSDLTASRAALSIFTVVPISRARVVLHQRPAARARASDLSVPSVSCAAGLIPSAPQGYPEAKLESTSPVEHPHHHCASPTPRSPSGTAARPPSIQQPRARSLRRVDVARGPPRPHPRRLLLLSLIAASHCSSTRPAGVHASSLIHRRAATLSLWLPLAALCIGSTPASARALHKTFQPPRTCRLSWTTGHAALPARCSALRLRASLHTAVRDEPWLLRAVSFFVPDA